MAAEVLSQALDELKRARANVQKTVQAQVRSQEERTALRSLAHAWFQSHRPVVAPLVEATALTGADAAYRIILDSAEKSAARKTYLVAMDSAREALITLRGHAIMAPSLPPTTEAAPEFSPLATDAVMQGILTRRWDECKKCLAADAPLAAIVMMGGLLEALFVARANRMKDKSPMFKARSTPRDRSNKPIDLRDWTLSPYLDVGHELGWITNSAKDVAAVLRDYRNYVHPEKERSHRVVLTSADGGMLWDVTKGLARQLLLLNGVGAPD